MKNLLLSKVFFIFGTCISSIFLNFFIFQYTNSLNETLIFDIYYFASMPFFAFVAGIVSKFLSSKVSCILGLFFNILTLLLVLFFPSFILSHSYILGLIQGISGGFYFSSTNNLSQHLTNMNNREDFNAKTSIFSNVASVIVPLFTALIVAATKSYTLVFIVATIFYFCSFIYLIPIKYIEPKSNFRPIYTLLIIRKNNDTWLSFKAIFIMGIYQGIAFTLLPILILITLPNIGWWGVYQTFLAILSIILTVYYQKMFKQDKAKYPLLLYSFMFAIVGLILSVNYNQIVFFIYTILNTIMVVIIYVSYTSIIQNITDEYKEFENRIIEKNIIDEFSLNSGRFLILLLIFLCPVKDFKNYSSISIIFLLLTVLPFCVSLYLCRANILRSKE